MTNITGNSPLVIFVGPASCGKTMVLMSLAEYLRKDLKYVITPDYNFIEFDDAYVKLCNEFKDKLNHNIAVERGKYKPAMSKTNKPIMVDVFTKTNKRVVRMLEAAGEDFFDPTNPAMPIERYITNAVSVSRTGRCPVYYVLLLDLHTRNHELYRDDTLRDEYQKRLIEICKNYKKGDKIILLYNKYDENRAGIGEDPMDIVKKKYNTLIDSLKRNFIGIHEYDGYDTLLPYVTGVDYHFEEDYEGKKGDVPVYYTDDAVLKYEKDLWAALTKKFKFL